MWGGLLFLAAPCDRPSGYLNLSLTVVAIKMTKSLGMYDGILIVRFLLF